MKTLNFILLALLSTCLFLAGCSDRPSSILEEEQIKSQPALSDAPSTSADISSAPGAPTPILFSTTFPDNDPCTDVFDPKEHMVTISGTAWVHALPNGNTVMRAKRTITTDSGYEGRGVQTEVINGNTRTFHLHDINTHPDGRKMRAEFVFIVDLSTQTVRVLRGALTCIKT